MKPIERVLTALDEAGLALALPEAMPRITGVTDDSRRVKAGFLFCAVKGTAQDGHRFVQPAIEAGAAAVLVSDRQDVTVPQIVVRDSRRATALAAAVWHGRPAEGMRLVGVTGTNGKSTTTALVRHLLNDDRSAGSIGTLGAFDGHGWALEEYGSLTTPGAVELQGVLAALTERGVRTVAMEASSHALDQGRLDTLVLAGAVYTNLTRDHLDYHANFEAYRRAKMRLSTLLGPDGVEAVNADDRAWDALPSRDGRRVRYGRARMCDVGLVRASLDADGSDVVMRLGDREVACRLPLVGDFNVSNALAAAALAWGWGVGPEAIGQKLGGAPQVPGRMERLASGEFTVVRDYAHTPDALARVVETLRPLTTGRLIVLFGAGGDRDRGKRPLMGEVVARAADLAIVTSDNPRTEDPAAIIRDIEVGMSGASYQAIVDRRAAIHHAVSLLRSGDCLLLAGKGHETYQVIGTESLPFDERAIVAEAFEERTPT